MDIRVLRYLLAVEQEGTITKAAESLGIAQPSLSKQLMELESEVGKPLLLRGKRQVTMTDEGQFLCRRAKEIISLLERTEAEISKSDEILSGEIRIGGGPSDTVIKAAAEFRRKYPAVRFHWVTGDADEITERMDRGLLDIAILIDGSDNPKYECLMLPETHHFGLLMRDDSPLSKKKKIKPEDVVNLPLIMPRRAGLKQRLTAWSGREELDIISTFNVVYSSPYLLVENGLGYAFSLENQTSERLCFCPLEPPISVSFSAVWRSHAPLSNASLKFISMLKKFAGTLTEVES